MCDGGLCCAHEPAVASVVGAGSRLYTQQAPNNRESKSRGSDFGALAPKQSRLKWESRPSVTTTAAA